jgi:hypothetical protein
MNKKPSDQDRLARETSPLSSRRRRLAKRGGRDEGRRTLHTFEALEERTLLSVQFPTPKPPIIIIHPDGSGGNSPSFTPQGYGPDQVRGAYSVNNVVFNGGIVGTGAGQTIAIVDAFSQPNIVSDLAAFDQQYGLPAPPSFKVVAQDGSSNLPGADPAGEWGVETSLDVEWAHSIAPAANLLLVATNDATQLYVGEAYAASVPAVSVISNSWGSGEFSTEQQLDSTFTVPAGHQGITFLSGSGDTGTPGLYPASSPNIVAVGGTSLFVNSDNSYQSESAWSGSGGGISQFEPQPSYQSGVVTQSTQFRTIPDVAAIADPNTGVAVYDSGDSPSSPWLVIGGTSLATPVFAGMIAIADQGAALLGKGPLDSDQVHSDLYNTNIDSGYFAYHDVTTGSNGLPAGPGYDLVTGIGTPKAPQLLSTLSGNLQAPTVSGASGQVVVSLPTFNWTTVPSAFAYNLVVTDTTSGTQALNVVVSGSNSTSFTPTKPFLTPGHSYSWTVSGVTGDNQDGVASSPSTFSFLSAPTPLSPTFGSTVTTTTPTFSWTPVGTATYTVSVADILNPTVPVFTASGITTTSFTATIPLTFGHDYTWTVQAVLQDFTTPAGVPVSFVVSRVGAPTPLTPFYGQGSSSTPTLSWTPVAGATGYDLILFNTTTSTQFPLVEVAGTSYVPSPALLPALIVGDSYQWSLKSFDNIGDVSGPSLISQFPVTTLGTTGGLTAPGSPAPSGTVNSATPTFTWAPVLGATTYFLYLIDPTTGVIYATPTGTTSAVPAVPLSEGHQYNWFVEAADAQGDVGPASAFATISVNFPPTPIAPVSGSVVNTFTPTFSWSSIPGAISYQLLLTNTTTGVPLTPISVTGTSFTLVSALLDDDAYTWGVSAVTLNGTTPVTGPESTPVAFSVSVPAVPTLLGPTGTIASREPTFSWDAVSGATDYLLTLIDTTTNTTILNKLVVTGTMFTPTTLLNNNDSFSWSLIAEDSLGNRSLSTAATNFKVNIQLTTPTLISPTGTATSGLPTFSWSTVPTAVSYKITVMDLTTNTVVESATVPAQTGSTTSITFTGTPLITGHNFNWTVTAEDSQGDFSQTPTPQAFGVLAGANLSLRPTPIGPSTELTTLTPTFSWTSVTGASGYYLEVFDTTGGTPTLLIATALTSASYTPITPLINGHAYSWQVLAFNASGSESGFTSLLPFTISFGTISGTVFLDSNANGTFDTGEQPMGGRTVFLDIHGTGILQPDDPQTVTGANGSFAMTIPSGTYKLLTITYPGDSVTTGSASITLNPGGNLTSENIGLLQGSNLTPVTPSPAPFGPGTNNNVQFAIVKGMYNLILGRAADPAGLSLWVARLGAGMTVTQLAQTFYSSPEYDTRIVNAYYEEFLGRAADPAGLSGWVGLMQAGATEAQVATALISSSEYSLLHSSNTAFVQSLYQNLLGRTPSAADLNTAVNSLATQSRASLANFFVNAPESITRAIDSLYVSILATPVNPTLVTLWVNAYVNGQLSIEAIASQIFGLPQYNARASGAVG